MKNRMGLKADASLSFSMTSLDEALPDIATETLAPIFFAAPMLP
jgi:hypothetical protein